MLYLHIDCELILNIKLDITQIHKLLSKKELNKFGDFIRSPFFNTEPRFVKLFELIELEGAMITRVSIAKKIFGPGASTGELRFRKLVSEFMKLFRRYMAETEFVSDTLSQQFMILEKFKKMNLRKEFLKQADDIIDYIENKTLKDELYYRNMADVYSRKYSVEDVNFKDYKKDLSFVINDYTDKYFVSMKIFLFQRFTTLEYSFDINIQQHKTFNKEILNFIELNRGEMKLNDPEIYLRYLALKLEFDGFNNEVYTEYVEIMTEFQNKIRINEYLFYLMLLNVLSKLINSGKHEYNMNVIDITKKMEGKGLFKKQPIHYQNLKIITESAIVSKEYDWAIEFMEDNKENISQINKESVFYLMVAKLYFFKEDYFVTRKFISKVSMDDYFHYIEAKLIECRVEFELKNYLSVVDSINTAKKFLQSHSEIGKDFRKAYNIFLSILFKLVKLHEKSGKDNILFELDMIEINILSEKNQIYAQSWIIEKIRKLRKGRL